jgi:hypothetical protein
MDCAVKMPIDLLQLPPFRQLRQLMGSAERALFVWFTLWQELGYRAQEGNCPGRLPAQDAALFTAALEPVERDPEKRAQLFQHLLTVRLLSQDGPDYVCPRFAILHGQMGARSQAQRGGDVRAYGQRMEKAEHSAFQQSLLVPPGKLVDGEGRPLPAEQVRRVMRLIVACDNALFKGARPSWGFGEGLIASALRVLQRFTDEEVNQVCLAVARPRNHPALNGVTTEKMLPMFGEMVGRLET